MIDATRSSPDRGARRTAVSASAASRCLSRAGRLSDIGRVAQREEFRGWRCWIVSRQVDTYVEIRYGSSEKDYARPAVALIPQSSRVPAWERKISIWT